MKKIGSEKKNRIFLIIFYHIRGSTDEFLREIVSFAVQKLILKIFEVKREIDVFLHGSPSFKIHEEFELMFTIPQVSLKIVFHIRLSKKQNRGSRIWGGGAVCH